MKLYKILGFMFILLFGLNVVNATTDDFVSCYDFDNFSDATGNYDLINSGTTSTTGITGSARLFSSGDYLRTSVTSPINNVINAWTHSYWIKTTSSTLNTALVNNMIEGTALMYAGGQFNRPTEDKIQVWLKSALGQEAKVQMTNSINMNDGGWHHIVILHEAGTSANKIKIFVDGVNQSMSIVTDTGLVSKSLIEQFVIGGFSQDGSISGTYVGTMDDVISYNRDLSDSEISTLYGGGSPPIVCNPVAVSYPYNIENATYNGVNLSISSQDTAPEGMTFNNIGSKLYMIGSNTDSIYEYNCSSSFSLSSCSYASKSFDVSSEDTSPTGMSFNNNGSKVYMIGSSTDNIYEYDCSTEYQIDTCSYNSKFLYVGGQEQFPEDMSFNNDGSKVFIVGDSNTRIYEYDCSTEYQIDTCSWDSLLYVGNQDTSPTGMSFNNDGSKVFMIGDSSDSMYEYDCSTEYQVFSCSYASKFLDVSSQDTFPTGMSFNNYGGKVYMVGTSTDSIYEYDIFFNRTPSITFDNITANGITFLNNTVYNTSNIIFETFLNVSQTNFNINHSYSLNGGSLIPFTVDNPVGTLNLTILTDADYTISFFANNNEANVTSQIFHFTIDTLQPNLSVNNFTEWNLGYNVTDLNITLNITCEDPNIVECEIHWDDNTTTDLFTTQYKLFTTNDNHTFELHAHDIANNSDIVNGTILINPIQRFHFTNGTGLVSNFTFGGVLFTGTEANFTTFNDILSFGTNIFLFEKIGYVSENFIFNINSTSDINATSNVTAAQIIVNIFNRLDGSVLSGRNVSINILGLGNQTTSTGQSIFQNFSFVPADYHLEAFSDGFYTTETDFTYSGEGNSIINVYMLNETQENVASLFIPVLDEFFNIIQDADTRLLEYDVSIFGFKEVSQCKTNSNGECKFLVEVGTKTYIITTSKTIGGVLFTAISSTDGEIFLPDIAGGEEVLGLEIIRQLFLKLASTLPNPASLGLLITVPDTVEDTIVSENSTTTVINIPVDFTALNGLSYTVCLEIYRVGGNNFFNVIDPVCLTGTAGILPVSNINLNNDFDYEARVTIEYNDVTTTYKTYPYSSTSSLVSILTEEGYVESSIIFLWVILLSVALYLRSISLWVYGSWTLSVVQVGLFPNVLTGSVGVVIILINIGVLYISKKQIDAV